MKRIISTCLLYVFFALPLTVNAQGSPPDLRRGDNLQNIPVGELVRTFIVYFPRSYRQIDGKRPAVLMLHGFGGNGDNALTQGKWREKAERERFLAVGLDGVLANPSERENFRRNPRSWNSGGLNEAPAEIQGIDDVAFVRATIDWLIATNMVDPNRIFVTGFSNGAAMTFRVGIELSDQIAAIAPHSNHVYQRNFMLKRPVSALMIMGTADPLNPLSGGAGKTILGEGNIRPPYSESWQVWSKALNCPTNAQKIYDQNGVQGFSYSPCKDGTEVAYYLVQDMGHNWAGGRNFLPEFLVGKKSDAIDATDLIWQFFENHPRKADN
ncbi:MAG: PHB depolymerase family esterase [Anaerolineae bacterium]